jgi:hypothetical protein
MTATGEARPVIGIDASRADAHGRLFDALEHVYQVDFVQREPGQWRGMDGVVTGFQEQAPTDGRIPILRAPSSADTAIHPMVIHTGSRAELGQPLGTRVLREMHAAIASPLKGGNGVVPLAQTDDGTVVWCVGNHLPEHQTAVPFPVVERGDRLRSHLCAGRFMSLLPLVHFVRAVIGDGRWADPGVRAALILDDPNLHRRSYGYLDYRTLAEAARAHSYHAVIGMIPLDGFHADRRVVGIFRDNRRTLSLAVHGNDHLRQELLRADRSRGMQLGATALRRSAAFERRFGLPVSRIMLPPHERASSAVLKGLLDVGFEGASGAPALDAVRSVGQIEVSDWTPACHVGGLPLFARHPISEPLDDLVFRAYLGQPLLLYGHHTDLADGLAPLNRVAAAINLLGQVDWLPLSSIARTNHRSRVSGSTLVVRMHSLAADIVVPPGVDRLRIELPPCPGGSDSLQLIVAGAHRADLAFDEAAVAGIDVDLPPGMRVDIALRRRTCSPRRRSVRVWPVARRVLTESRDRTLPVRRQMKQRLLAAGGLGAGQGAGS